MADEKESKVDINGIFEAARGFLTSDQFKDWSANAQALLTSPTFKAAQKKGEEVAVAFENLAQEYGPKIQEIAKAVEFANDAHTQGAAPASRGRLAEGVRMKPRAPVDFAREQARLLGDLHGSLISSGQKKSSELSCSAEVTQDIEMLCSLTDEEKVGVRAAAKEAYDEALAAHLED